MARRSVLFAPGDSPDIMQKAAASDTDVVVFDLEDAVAPDDKAAARQAVADVLETLDDDGDTERCVRVNPVDNGAAQDVESAFADAVPDSVMLPKAERSDDVLRLRELLRDVDASRPVLALVESAAGVLNADEIAAAAATDALLFGAEDLTADIGATRTDAGTEVLYARQRAVTAASAAGVDAIDTVYTDFGDTEGLRAATETAAEFGYDGKMAIHPDQVPVINEAFTPDESAIEWAERVIEADEKTDAGVFEVDGEMIDAPLVTRAERILRRAEEAGRR